jgi:hypothetical protein
LFAPDGLAIDVEGNLYSVLPPAGLAPFPVSPVIKIYPDTGIVEPVIPPYTYPLLPPPYDALFDYPTSLAFGNGRLDNMSLFVVSPTPGQSLSSGPVITQVGVGVPGARFPGFWFDWDDD